MKITTILIGIIVLAAAIVGGSDFFWWKLNFPGFGSASARAVEKAEDLVKKSGAFNKTAVLRSLKKNPLNGYSFRLDDNLSMASVVGDKTRRPALPQTNIGFDFAKPGNNIFQVNKGSLSSGNGALKLKYEPDCFLFTSEKIHPLNIPLKELSALVIKARHRKGNRMTIYWNIDTSSFDRRWITDKGHTLNVVPDGKFHEYYLDTETFFHHQRGEEKFLNNIAFEVSNVPGDDVDIESVRLISKKDDYSKALFGVTDIYSGKELRPAIFMVPGIGLKYDVKLPSGEATMSFGLSSIDSRYPVNCSVTVDGEGGKTEVFNRRVTDDNGWADFKINLGRWQGQKIGITLLTTGSAEGVAFWSSPVISTNPAKRFNVVIYLEDALRADHLSTYGYPRETSPFKTTFSKEGALFLDTFSQSTETRTSIPSIMTGLPPTATGVWSLTESLDENYLTVAEVLRSQGFTTASFTQSAYSGPINGLNRGFDYLFDNTVFGHRTKDIISDKPLFAWLDSHKDKNFFVYVHVLAPHGIYDPMPPYDNWYLENPGATPVEFNYRLDPKRITKPTMESRRSLYDGEIKCNDDNFKRFVEKLKALGVYNDTLIIFTADHGEHMGEHGMWLHRPPGFTQTIHVPLIMVYPNGIKGGTQRRQTVQSIDIVPTILDYAGIDNSKMLIEGDSLRPLIDGKDLDFWAKRIVVSDEVINRDGHDDLREMGSVFSGGYHYLATHTPPDIHYSPSKEVMLFDMAKDATEETDVLSRHYIARKKLSSFLTSMHEKNAKVSKAMAKGKTARIKTTPEALEQLKSLGYIQ